MSHQPRRDDGSCCGAVEAGTPVHVDNQPGRPAVSRRVGIESQFAATMAARLTRQPELEGFTNRRSDDPTIALVDSWAAVLDVLTFYTERVANEAYLRTAVESRSMVELVHTVGYVPGRGRASGAQLAFTLEDAPGSPAVVPIPAGTRVASLPGPGELPQTYETVEDLDARPQWNAMQARTREPQTVRGGATFAYVEGVRTDLAVGDAILVVGREREAAGASASWAFRQLSSVRMLPDQNTTQIFWADPLGSPPASSGRIGDETVPDPRDLRLFVLRRKANIFGANAPDYRLIVESAGGGRPDRQEPVVAIQAALGQVRGPSRERLTRPGPGPDWPGFSVPVPGQPENTVDLDASYAMAVPGSWVVLTRPGVTACYQVRAHTEESRTDFTLNAKVSRLSLQGPYVTPLFGRSVRQTAAWVGSELLPLATAPVRLPVQRLQIRLARPVPAIEAGRSVIVSGPRPRVRVAEGVRSLVLRVHAGRPVQLHPGDELEVTGPVTENADGTITWVTRKGAVTARPTALERVAPDDEATVWSEIVTMAGPTPDDPEVETLQLAAPLQSCYDHEAVRVLGNVAVATHGDTKTQVLGSGDASRSFQRFTLASAPLTYVPAKSGGDVTSTLTVRVDGRLWSEVPMLLGTGPQDEVFTTHTDDEGTVTVLFGDGLTGARPSTGTNNVTAAYRVGTGVAGRVKAGQLTQPMTRPLGLHSVTNPLASGLAADPESVGEARSNAPRTVLTLDRVVSLRDFEDFARAVPGIAKAQATWLWNGQRRFVHLTVAGAGGQPVDAQALADLRTALITASDARVPLQVAEVEVVPVHVSVSVVVDPAHDGAVVLGDVIRAVTRALEPDARALGQPLTAGDIIMAAHSVRGVVAVNVTLPKTDVAPVQAHVAAGVARPAQLLVLAPGGLTVTEAVS